MPLFGKKAKGKTTKLFFVTDVHGSQTTFRKFVNAGKFYEVDVLVLGGDIAGKMVVPILDLGGGSTAPPSSRSRTSSTAATRSPISRREPASSVRTRRW